MDFLGRKVVEESQYVNAWLTTTITGPLKLCFGLILQGQPGPVGTPGAQGLIGHPVRDNLNFAMFWQEE